MLEYIMQGWVSAFEQEIPDLLEQFSEDLIREVSTLRNRMEIQASFAVSGIIGVETLRQKLPLYAGRLTEVIHKTLGFVNRDKRRVNRSVAPIIHRHMQLGYDMAKNESGNLHWLEG